MDKKDIYEMMDRFDKSGLSDIEVEMNGVKVMMRKAMVSNVSSVAVSGNNSYRADENSKSVDLIDVNVQSNKVENNNINIDVETIKAPLVGTFYSAPSPDSKPYVAVGSKVKKGEVIGISEAMKLMNEITAPEDGEIIAVEVDNEEMVEFDQVIMRYRR